MLPKSIIYSCLAMFIYATAVGAQTPQADNTKQNVGATRKHAVIADKQDNRRSDIKVLAKLRRHITFDKGLSMDAKNVKILVKTGVVTLAGPVDSEAEKARIEQLAKNCEGVQSINNMLTVAEKKH